MIKTYDSNKSANIWIISIELISLLKVETALYDRIVPFLNTPNIAYKLNVYAIYMSCNIFSAVFLFGLWSINIHIPWENLIQILNSCQFVLPCLCFVTKTFGAEYLLYSTSYLMFPNNRWAQAKYKDIKNVVKKYWSH